MRVRKTCREGDVEGGKSAGKCAKKVRQLFRYPSRFLLKSARAVMAVQKDHLKMADLVRLVAEKNKQRAALKKEYWKQMTNPNNAGHGVVFDHALQRIHAMRVTRIDHFRETPKNFALLMVMVVIPAGLTCWMIKNDRDKKEALYRSGQVAYKDRRFKLC